MKKIIIYLLFVVYALLAAFGLYQWEEAVSRSFNGGLLYLAAPALLAFIGGLLLMLEDWLTTLSPCRGRLRVSGCRIVFTLVLRILSQYWMLAYTVFTTGPSHAFFVNAMNSPLDLPVLFAFAAGVAFSRAFHRG